MNDLEHALGPSLHDLADELAGSHPVVPAADAITRHRRDRRARAAMAALALVVALIAVGVPTGMNALRAGSSGHGATAGPPATPAPGHATSSPSAGSATPADAAAGSAAQQDHAQIVLQRLAEQLPQPLRLTAPATWKGCPPTIHMQAVAGAPFVYWQGHLPGGPDGCQYVVAPAAAGTSTSATRESVGIGFLTGTTVEQMDAGVASSDSSSGGTCSSGPASGGAVLQRCQVPGQLRYYLTVPDSGGRGVWVLSVSTGDQYDVDPGMALQAVTLASMVAFPG